MGGTGTVAGTGRVWPLESPESALLPGPRRSGGTVPG